MDKQNLKHNKISHCRKYVHQSKKMKTTSKNNPPESKKLFLAN